MPFRPRYGARRQYRPARRYRKTTYRKKRNSRFKAGWKRKMSSSSPFATRKFCTLKYAWTTTGADEFICGSAGTANARRSFALNSLYDPYFEVGGTQPRYFDTLCGPDNTTAPYYQYRVHACKFKVTFNNGNSAGQSNGNVMIRIRDSAIAEAGVNSTMSDWKELPWTQAVDIGSGVGASNRRSFRKFVKINKYYGIKDIADQPEYAATYTANPGKMLIADIAYNTPFAGGTNYALVTTVEMKFYCEFFNLNYPAPS